MGDNQRWCGLWKKMAPTPSPPESRIRLHDTSEPICKAPPDGAFLRKSNDAVESVNPRPGREIALVMFRVLTLFVTLVLAPPAWPQARDPLTHLLELTGITPGESAPDPARVAASPTREQQLPLFRAVMARPLDAPYRAGMLADAYREAVGSPHELIGLTGAVAGLDRRPFERIGVDSAGDRFARRGRPVGSQSRVDESDVQIRERLAARFAGHGPTAESVAI